MTPYDTETIRSLKAELTATQAELAHLRARVVEVGGEALKVCAGEWSVEAILNLSSLVKEAGGATDEPG